MGKKPIPLLGRKGVEKVILAWIVLGPSRHLVEVVAGRVSLFHAICKARIGPT